MVLRGVAAMRLACRGCCLSLGSGPIVRTSFTLRSRKRRGRREYGKQREFQEIARVVFALAFAGRHAPPRACSHLLQARRPSDCFPYLAAPVFSNHVDRRTAPRTGLMSNGVPLLRTEQPETLAIAHYGTNAARALSC